MNYLQFAFSISSGEEYQRDLLINALSEAGFDTFEETPVGFNAFIPSASYDEDSFLAAVSLYQTEFIFQWEKTEIPQENWNEVWESNFEPLVIKDECYVRATFHEPKPEHSFEIIVDPKMAFGTGHHQTTTMMLEFILEGDFAGKRVLDMGAGTGILAILASKRGASEIVAIDYDPVCYDSIVENSRLNNTPFSEILCGSKEIIPQNKYDVILANINRNILLDQMESYADVLATGGNLYISGFYESDKSILLDKAIALGLAEVSFKTLDTWCSVKLLKQT